MATYLTELPPKALLQKKLRAAAELARERLKEGGSGFNRPRQSESCFLCREPVD